MIADLTAIEEGLDRALGAVLTVPLLLGVAARDEQVATADEQAIRSLGWLGIALEERDGGLGLDCGGLISVGAAAGRRLMPVPLREEAVAVAPLLALLAGRGDDVAATQLSALLSGALRGGVVVVRDGPPGAADERDAAATTVIDSGTVGWLARDAAVAAVVGNTSAAVIDLSAEGTSVTPMQALEAGQGFAEVIIAPGSLAWIDGAEVVALLRRRRAFLVGEAFGCAERCLLRALDHTRAREQFGRPLASFQAVAHQLADMTMQVETLRSTLSRLDEAWREGDEATSDAVLAALAWVAPAFARTVCETSIQLHGGTGFTWEYGLHLHYRRVLHLQAVLGGVRESAEAVARQYMASRRRHTDAG